MRVAGSYFSEEQESQLKAGFRISEVQTESIIRNTSTLLSRLSVIVSL